MKKSGLIFLTILLSGSLLVTACQDSLPSPPEHLPATAPPAQQEKDKDNNPLTGITAADIAWITKKGGLPSPNKNWPLLYPEEDGAVVGKILDMIHSCANLRRSTEEDLDFLTQRHGYPVDLVIRLKDGGEFSLKPAMKLEVRETGNGTEITGTTYRDRFILAHTENGGTEYYTVFSGETVAYILTASDPDFPRDKPDSDEDPILQADHSEGYEWGPVRKEEDGSLTVEKTREVIPDTLLVSKTVSGYAHNQHAVWVDGKYKKEAGELFLTLTDARGNLLQTAGFLAADEVRAGSETPPAGQIPSSAGGWTSFSCKLIEDTWSKIDIDQGVIVFELRRSDKVIHGELAIPLEKPG